MLALALALAALALWYSPAWSVPLWIVALFVLQFFRDPPRKVPAMAGAVLAPADGRVVMVGRTHDP